MTRIRSESSLELQRVRQLHFEARQMLAKVLPEWAAMLDEIHDMVAVDAPGERNQWRCVRVCVCVHVVSVRAVVEVPDKTWV